MGFFRGQVSILEGITYMLIAKEKLRMYFHIKVKVFQLNIQKLSFIHIFFLCMS